MQGNLREIRGGEHIDRWMKSRFQKVKVWMGLIEKAEK
jgi:hypothetical protein